jgi:hypothetical protein
MATRAEKLGFPPSQVPIKGVNKRLEVGSTKLPRGEREPQVSLREARGGTPERGRHECGGVGIDMERNKGGLVIIDFKASGVGEFFQQRTQDNHRGHITLGQDKCIVCVLENRSRERRVHGVVEQARS